MLHVVNFFVNCAWRAGAGVSVRVVFEFAVLCKCKQPPVPCASNSAPVGVGVFSKSTNHKPRSPALHIAISNNTINEARGYGL